MVNFGFIKREVLFCFLLCLTVYAIEALDSNEAEKLNRKIDVMVGGLQGQLITAVLEIEALRASTGSGTCKCEQQFNTGKYSFYVIYK